ncbi:MAG: NAD(P)H-binding protein [Anaerolineae bacterium]|nr:NAD(P)H-binding protein [Anaerolineae bacterium]
MILITGGTGFIGQNLIRHLVSEGRQVRILLRPSQASRLPAGVPLDVTVSSLTDARGLQAAMRGVDTVYHLISAERQGIHADLNTVDVDGTQALVTAAQQAGVKRFFYLSHLGADRASAYPVLKAKGFAENIIISSGLPYTIFRSGPVTGPGDQFTEPLKKLILFNPFVFLMPDDGLTLIQPIWIEDLITCMTLALDDPQTTGQLYSIGGLEYLPFENIVSLLMEKLSIKRRIINVQSAYLRMLGVWFEQFNPRFPFPLFWLDYLSTDRTCALDTMPRVFGLIPARFSNNLDYLLKD